MPRVIETTVYKYDELSDKAKEVARQWFREGSAGDCFWAESLTGKGCDFETVAKLCGWTLIPNRRAPKSPAIFWSGFWSQGDGLHFYGDWRAADVDAPGLKAHAPQDSQLHGIVDSLAATAKLYPKGTGAIEGRDSRYCHEFTVSPELYEDDIQEDDSVADAAAQSFREATRALMKWMYRCLECEYEYQNSDEAVEESIKANEYEFLDTGKFAR